MRFYYTQLPKQQPQFRRNNWNKWVIVDNCQIMALFSENDAVTFNQMLRNCSSEAFIQQIGEERSPSPSAEVILPIEDSSSALGPRPESLLLRDLQGSKKGKIRIEYHPHEGELVDSATFEPRLYLAGGYPVRRMIAWLLLQTDPMVKEGKGIPATFLVHTGCPDMKLHRELFESLQCNPDSLISVCGRPNNIVKELNSDMLGSEGVNYCGMQTLLQLGIQIDATMGQKKLLHLREDTSAMCEETDLKYKVPFL